MEHHLLISEWHLRQDFSVIGASIGFKLSWGPIYWGLISACIGFVLGFIIRLFIECVIKKRKKEF